jgi:hypothetical protein
MRDDYAEENTARTPPILSRCAPFNLRISSIPDP